MNSLAGTLRAQGDLAGARSLEEEALTIRRRSLGEEHPDTLISMNNLSHTLWELGDFVRARALEEQVWETRRRVLGEEHPKTLISTNNLAKTLSRNASSTAHVSSSSMSCRFVGVYWVRTISKP
jgi:hypothetical protein